MGGDGGWHHDGGREERSGGGTLNDDGVQVKVGPKIPTLYSYTFQINCRMFMVDREMESRI